MPKITLSKVVVIDLEILLQSPGHLICISKLIIAASLLEGELFGNGLNTKRVFDPFTGELKAIRTGVAGDLKRNLTYQYNARGSVSQRHDVMKDIVETFQYDELDRLTYWELNNPRGNDYRRDYRYDTQGNLTYKTNAGDFYYEYERGTRNQLSSRVTPDGQTIDDYRYDGNGNMIQGDGRSYQWTAFNKVASVTTAAGVTRYQYGAGGSRVKKVEGGVTTYYFGRDYEVIIETDALGRTLYRPKPSP